MQQLVIACVSVRPLPSHLRTPSLPSSPHLHSLPPHTLTLALQLPSSSPRPLPLSAHTYTHNPFKRTHTIKTDTHTHTRNAQRNTQRSTHTRGNTPHTHRRHATQPLLSPSPTPLPKPPPLHVIPPHPLPPFHPPSPLPTDTIRATDDQLHVHVVDVVKLFDTVNFSILDCALGRLSLFKWFRRVYFSFMLRLGRGFSLM